MLPRMNSSTDKSISGFDVILAKVFSSAVAPKQKPEKPHRNYGNDYRKSPLPFSTTKFYVFSYPTFYPTDDPAQGYLIGW
jgi:hypothetical protein